MTIALISTSPASVLATYAGPLANVNVPGLWQASNVGPGWQSTDGVYKLVAVTSFVVPVGQETVGVPTYSLNDGVVVETYVTQPIPVPPPAPFTATTSPTGFRLLFTGPELLATTSLGLTNASVRLFLDEVSIATSVDLSSDFVSDGLMLLQQLGVLSAARASAILRGRSPPGS